MGLPLLLLFFGVYGLLQVSKAPFNPVLWVCDRPITKEAFVSELFRLEVFGLHDEKARERVAKRLLHRLRREALWACAARLEKTTLDPVEIKRFLYVHAQNYYDTDWLNALHHAYWIPRLLDLQVEEQLLMAQYLHREFQQYKQNKPLFLSMQKAPQAQIRLRHIVLQTREEAESLKNSILSGKLGFEKAASLYSQASDRIKGGDMGFFFLGQLPKEFGVCFGLSLGEMAPVIATEEGFHLVQAVEKRQKSPLDIKQYSQEEVLFKQFLDKLESKLMHQFYWEIDWDSFYDSIHKGSV